MQRPLPAADAGHQPPHAARKSVHYCDVIPPLREAAVDALHHHSIVAAEQAKARDDDSLLSH